MTEASIPSAAQSAATPINERLQLGVVFICVALLSCQSPVVVPVLPCPQTLSGSNASKAVRASRWEEFHNYEYRYSVEFPSSWSIHSSKPEDVVIGLETMSGGALFGDHLGVFVHRDNSLTTREQITQSYPDGCTTEEAISFADEPAWHLVCIEAYSGATREIYLVAKGDRLYEMYFQESRGEQSEIWGKIAATFRFR